MVHELFYFSFFLGLTLVYNLHKLLHLCNIGLSDFLSLFRVNPLSGDINNAVLIAMIKVLVAIKTENGNSP